MEKGFQEYLDQFVKFTNRHNKEIYYGNQGRDDIQAPVEPEIGRFLAFLVKMTGAKRVLELGTGVGNSAIWLAEALKEQDGMLYTVDNHPRTWTEACENIEKSGLKDTITMIHSDADEAVRMLREQNLEFDIVFQDCAKYIYTVIYEDVAALVRKGGIIVADDTMFPVCQNIRENLGRHMDRYNRQIFADKRFFSTMLPIGHGMTLSWKW
ncbi:MAG: class I SAM-dependent methyltransferase [Spirochaetia bacterium]|nr:class I SAM-dependent methyltransferase [Spirochaetia bacterium]